MKTIVTCILAASSLAAAAQEQTQTRSMKKMTWESTNFINFGASYQNFNSLNDRVRGFSQYDQAKDYIGTVQLGGIHKCGQFMSIGTLTIGSNLTGQKEKRSTNVGMLGLAMDFGYDVIKSPKVDLYPTVGVGIEGYRVRFNRDVSNVSFNDVFTNPGGTEDITRSLTFKNRFWTYRAGLNANFQCKAGMGIGLQAGYAGSFQDRDWRINGSQKLANAPSDNLVRPYASISFTKSMGSMKWGHK